MSGVKIFMIAIVGSLLVGVAIGAVTFGGADQQGGVAGSSAAVTPAAVDDLRFDRLSARLEETERLIAAQQILLEQLRQEVRAFGTSGGAVSQALVAKETEQGGESAASQGLSVSVESFLDAGFSKDDAVLLDERYAELELRRLYLRNQAVREGWIREERFRSAQQKLDEDEKALVADLGEDAYDRYLYATGQPNRVRVTSVIRRSPAERSGIESDDVIYRYAGTRVYNSFDLQNATSEGEPGRSVAVEVLREGKLLEFYIARGPLGVQLQSDSVTP